MVREAALWRPSNDRTAAVASATKGRTPQAHITVAKPWTEVISDTTAATSALTGRQITTNAARPARRHALP